MNQTIRSMTTHTQLITTPFSDTVLVDDATNELGHGHIFFRIRESHAIKQALRCAFAHLQTYVGVQSCDFGALGYA